MALERSPTPASRMAAAHVAGQQGVGRPRTGPAAHRRYGFSSYGWRQPTDLSILGVARIRAARLDCSVRPRWIFSENTVYTWPKLSAAAFACGAFGLLVFPTAGPDDHRRRWAAALAGLAWLSHGGVAFRSSPLCRSSLRPIPVIGASGGRRRSSNLVTPWLAYQKCYDPPANRFFKWHLPGNTKGLPRHLGNIRDSYSALPAREIWRNKITNFHSQVFGEWRNLVDVTSATFAERLHHAFLNTARAQTWWPLLALGRIGREPSPDYSWETAVCSVALGSWIALTIILWCLLMFGTYQAVIDHGSYAVMIGLFVLFSVMLDRAGRGWFAVIVGAAGGGRSAPRGRWKNTVISGPPTGDWSLSSLRQRASRGLSFERWRTTGQRWLAEQTRERRPWV